MRRTMRAFRPVLALMALLPACCSAGEGGRDDRGAHPKSPAVLAATDSVEVRLGDGPLAVNVPVATQARERLAEAAESGSLWLRIEGLRLLRPGGYYQVYLNLPAGEEPDPKGPHFVGNLSLYGAEPGGAADLERSFDVTEEVRHLRALGLWGGEVTVTFVRGNRDAAPAGEGGAFVSLRRISLRQR